MSWKIGKAYPDTIGRMWTVDSILGTLIMRVSCPRLRHGILTQHAIAIIEADMPDRATVPLKDGFTTIYTDEEEEEKQNAEEYSGPTTRKTKVRSCPFCGANYYPYLRYIPCIGLVECCRFCGIPLEKEREEEAYE